MKKSILILSAAVIMLSSCATVMGGKITSCQKTKPATGHRDVRLGWEVVDVCFGLVPLLVDFATGAIYRPCDTKTEIKK